jgi:hypothetical protein
MRRRFTTQKPLGMCSPLRWLLILVLAFHTGGTVQSQKRRLGSYFGVQVRPVLPTRFIGESSLTLTQDGFSTTFDQSLGYSFGGIIRKEFTQLLGIESGINFTQRNYGIRMEIPDSNVFATNDMSFISYDIPINALVYIQLADRLFANASFGIATVFKPSNVGVLTLPGGSHSFTHTGRLYSKASLEFNANLGIEFRTKKSGYFYLGGSGRIPFKPVFELIAQYKYQGYKNTIREGVDGSFLAIDIKYFFPEIANRGEQFKEGPIK